LHRDFANFQKTIFSTLFSVIGYLNIATFISLIIYDDFNSSINLY